MENINEEYINSLIKIEPKYNLRKTCNRKMLSMESLKNTPNPQNNKYKIYKLKMEVQNYSNKSNKIISTVQNQHYIKPLKFSKNLNTLCNYDSQSNIYLQQNRIKLLRKCFNLWKLKCIHSRNTKSMKRIQEIHQSKIANFLEVLQKRKETIEQEEKIKPKLIRSANIKSKTFKNNRKTCSAPSLSKLKHLENLNSIEIDINKSLNETRTDFKALTLPKLKSCYIKVDQNDKTLKLFTKVPETILKSQELARQRAEKRNILAEKKRLLNEKMQRALEEAELMKKRLELEYKKEQLKDYKDKKRKEEEKADRILKEKIHGIELFKKSKNHYHIKLKQKFFNKLKLVRTDSLAKLHTADEFYKMNLLQKHLVYWKQTIQTEIKEIYSKAIQHHRRIVLSVYFQIWIENYRQLVIKNQVADDFYEFKLMPRIFGKWHGFTCLQYIHWQDLKGTAIVHHNCNLKRRYFKNWRIFLEIIKSEKDKNKRLQKWIRKVQEIIPNFEPIRD